MKYTFYLALPLSCACCEYITSSLHLARKYARIFVRGHYLFRGENNFPPLLYIVLTICLLIQVETLQLILGNSATDRLFTNLYLQI